MSDPHTDGILAGIELCSDYRTRGLELAFTGGGDVLIRRASTLQALDADIRPEDLRGWLQAYVRFATTEPLDATTDASTEGRIPDPP